MDILLDNKIKNNIMKKLNLLFTALLLMCCLGNAKAEEVTIDGINYDVITKAKLATVITGWGDYSGDIVVPSEITYNNVTYSVTSIGEGAFYDCTGLTSITIPNSVTSIGERAFYRCSGLKSITIPNGVTSIGDDTFSYCSGLTSVTIGNSVTSIGDYAFYNCDVLTSITIPNSVKSIGYQAFQSCDGLTSVTIGNSVTSIGRYAFSGCYGLKSVTIGNSVTSIGDAAFNYCYDLTSVEFNATNCTSIGSSNYPAFKGCTSLSIVTIGENVKNIPAYAFYGCSNLTSITIPNSVTRIGYEAFSNCSNLTDVYCLATNVPATKSDAFNGSYPEYMTLHVPAEAINSYKTTEPWSSFGNIVTLDGDIVETPKCDNPVIKYNNGEIEIECETADAEFVTAVTNNYTGNYYSNNFALTATYNISVYATATGYDNSDTVNATLCWIECDCNDNNNNNIINIPAKAVFVTSNNGTINISCSLEGENVAVYSSDAMYVGSATIENGCATIESGLSKGDIAIIKIAEKSIKVILN